MWIILGGGVVLFVLWFSRSYHSEAELGTVSAQWLAEYRQDHDSSR